MNIDAIEDDLRERISANLLRSVDLTAADARSIFSQLPAADDSDDRVTAIAASLGRLLAQAVARGRIEAEDGGVAAVRAAAVGRALAITDLFGLAFLVERTMLDELALDADIGVATERWPAVAQFVRRASFDVLGAIAARSAEEAGAAVIFDRATTLHTRALFDTVLAKEADRAGRFGYAIALVLFDVDRLGELNERHGQVTGDRILERLGVLVRQYFRQHDWVARYADDAIAVLLTRTDAGHADELADKVRITVADRLGSVDHRSDTEVLVTVSAGVAHVAGKAGTLIDPERLRVDAETALERAKRLGRNRVERVDGPASASRALPRSSPST